MNGKSFLWIFLMVFFIKGYAQNSISNSSQNIINENKKLEKSIEQGDTEATAESYYTIGMEYFNNDEYAKAEQKLQKSLDLYTSLDKKDEMAKVSKQLALVQVKLNKLPESQTNFNTSYQNTKSPIEKTIVENEIFQQTSNSLPEKEKAIQQNITLNAKLNNWDEVATNYEQLAVAQKGMDEPEKAILSLEEGIKLLKKNNPKQALELNNTLSNFYIAQKNTDKAIEVQRKVLQETYVNDNSEEKIEQTQKLAQLLLQKDQKEALQTLKEAYKLAIENGHTLYAQTILSQMDSIYSLSKNYNASLAEYRTFLQQLPELIEKDESLKDASILKEVEEKIDLLENEKALQKEIISKKNLFNYSLLGIVLILSILALVVYILNNRLSKKNKKISLVSLRREMNPHFIFNSLNSINQFIATHDEKEANKYLSHYSKLMRGVLEHSSDDFMPLQEELELLKNYLQLEKQRFSDVFDYEVHISETLQNQNIYIPGMLIQPYLENAIWHGLRYKEEKGWLQLHFSEDTNKIIISIEDNGIGIQASQQLKTKHQNQHNSRGLSNNKERMALLNDLYNIQLTEQIEDKAEGGVRVILAMKKIDSWK